VLQLEARRITNFRPDTGTGSGVGLHALVKPPFALTGMAINADNERLAFFVCD